MAAASILSYRTNCATSRAWRFGYPSSRHFNIAFLGKLIADLVVGKDSPWESLLNNRYGCIGIIFPLDFGSCSHTYRKIRKASAYLLDGFNFCVGSGNWIFWYSPWLSKLPSLLESLTSTQQTLSYASKISFKMIVGRLTDFTRSWTRPSFVSSIILDYLSPINQSLTDGVGVVTCKVNTRLKVATNDWLVAI